MIGLLKFVVASLAGAAIGAAFLAAVIKLIMTLQVRPSSSKGARIA